VLQESKKDHGQLRNCLSVLRKQDTEVSCSRAAERRPLPTLCP
jgi:hypothetical protein